SKSSSSPVIGQSTVGTKEISSLLTSSKLASENASSSSAVSGLIPSASTPSAFHSIQSRLVSSISPGVQNQQSSTLSGKTGLTPNNLSVVSSSKYKGDFTCFK
ncbi:hypothetical protein AB205_0018900, partial [Aquarana catesbeiana]